MSQNAPHPGKLAAAQLALQHIPRDAVLGVGSGSTVNILIDEMARQGVRLEGAVASSVASANRLEAAGYDVLDLNMTGTLDLYIDGADECDPSLALIKGGGGALTREKIVAAASREFLCIVDESKCVERLGEYPLPIEVIPMARSYVAREIVKLGADPEYREGPATDNGNIVLDCYGFEIDDPVTLENRINQMAGVVTVGLFANRRADRLLVGLSDGSTRSSHSA